MLWFTSVPDKVAEYAATDDRETRRQIVAKIAASPDKAVAAALEMVGSGRMPIATAVEFLAHFGGDDVFGLLVAGMGAGIESQRIVALTALDRGWMPREVGRLVPLLADGNNHIRAGAETLLLKYPEKLAADKLIPLLKSDNKDQVRKVINLLAHLRSEAGAKAIALLLDSANPWVKKKAIDGLVAIGSKEVIGKLRELLAREKDHDVLKATVHAIGYLGSPIDAVSLVPVLQSDDMVVRQLTVDVIVKIGDSSVVEPVVRLMRSQDRNVRRAAADVLRSLSGPQVGATLVKALKDEDWWVREIAVEALAERADESLNHLVVALLKEDDPYIRRIGAEYFCHVRYAAAFDGLQGLLGDDDWWTRERALIALGRQGDPRAVGLVVRALEDKQIRLAVPEALALIRNDEALVHLQALAAAPDRGIRAKVVAAAALFGGAEGKGLLEPLTNDSDAEISALANRRLADMTTLRMTP
ncbi:MAG: HEAT repeat domain-containing protein [Nitrospinae bacterium]|nr:HEAT repeat domain-containing protein [Nitrospinota bacterium]